VTSNESSPGEILDQLRARSFLLFCIGGSVLLLLLTASAGFLDTDPAIALLALLLVATAPPAVWLAMVLRGRGLSFEFLLGERPTRRALLRALLHAPFLAALQVGGTWLLRVALSPSPDAYRVHAENVERLGLHASSSTSWYLGATALAVIVGAIIGELSLRGFLLQRWGRRYGAVRMLIGLAVIELLLLEHPTAPFLTLSLSAIALAGRGPVPAMLAAALAGLLAPALGLVLPPLPTEPAELLESGPGAYAAVLGVGLVYFAAVAMPLLVRSLRLGPPPLDVWSAPARRVEA
jgi:membrane protease YdiL (CAAX protease family)